MTLPADVDALRKRLKQHIAYWRGGVGYAPDISLTDLLDELDLALAALATKAGEGECKVCGKTPPFPGGTRCQRTDCGLIEWEAAPTTGSPAPSRDEIVERRVRNALVDLVLLKDLKEWIEEGLSGCDNPEEAKSRYAREKEPAWEAARLALESVPNTDGQTPETDAHLSHLNLGDGRKVGIPDQTVELLRSLEQRLADSERRCAEAMKDAEWVKVNDEFAFKYINAAPGRPVWFIASDGQVWAYHLPKLPVALAEAHKT